MPAWLEEQEAYAAARAAERTAAREAWCAPAARGAPVGSTPPVGTTSTAGTTPSVGAAAGARGSMAAACGRSDPIATSMAEMLTVLMRGRFTLALNLAPALTRGPTLTLTLTLSLSLSQSRSRSLSLSLSLP